MKPVRRIRFIFNHTRILCRPFVNYCLEVCIEPCCLICVKTVIYKLIDIKALSSGYHLSYRP